MGTTEILVIIAMLLLNSLFAAYELALASVSLGRLKLFAEQKRRGAAAALAMKGRMEASLAVVQIGITLVGAIAAATGGAGAEEYISPSMEAWLGVSSDWADIFSIGLVVLPLSALTIIIGELVPKTVAIRHSEWVCLKLSSVMRVFSLFVYPAMLGFEWATKVLVRLFERQMPDDAGSSYEIGLAELRAQARALRTSRIIGADQERIILGASTLTRVKVGDILVPPQDIVMLNADASLTDHFVVIHLEGYSRFPVTQKPGDAQGIIGYANLKELIFLAKAHPENPSLRQIARPLPNVSPEMPIGQAFSMMMREHVHMVLVRDTDGIVRGIITLEDILEEIVGDIQDEFDRLPRQVAPSGQYWVVGGGAILAQLRDAVGNQTLGGTAAQGTTLADWLEARATQTLKGGDVITIDGFRILIRKMRRRKVLEALVSKEPCG
ncbi:MAG: HlyC/CorC family transporter [Planctomycetaceae bacterium]|nr:MAG: HlyC/CorC family transporter [Planctomycetaceae bacterium]